MSDPREGIAFYTREYEQALMLATAEEAGLVIMFQKDQVIKLCALLAAKGFYLVKPTGEAVPFKVERLMEGKDQGNLAPIYKG